MLRPNYGKHVPIIYVSCISSPNPMHSILSQHNVSNSRQHPLQSYCLVAHLPWLRYYLAKVDNCFLAQYSCHLTVMKLRSNFLLVKFLHCDHIFHWPMNSQSHFYGHNVVLPKLPYRVLNAQYEEDCIAFALTITSGFASPYFVDSVGKVCLPN